MEPILQTDRLTLRKFNSADTDLIIALLNSPGWLQFIGDRGVTTPEQARQYLEQVPIKSYHQNGYGLFLVEQKENGQAIGMCGLINRPGLACPDLGFALLPAFPGRGYAREIAAATIAYSRNVLQIPRLAAITVPENSRSIRLLEKLGFAFSRNISLPGSAAPLLLFFR